MKRKYIVKRENKNKKVFKSLCKNPLNDFLQRQGYIINVRKYEADGEETLKSYEEYREDYLKYLSYEETEDLTIKWYENFMEDKLKDFCFMISLYPQSYKAKPNEKEREDKFRNSK